MLESPAHIRLVASNSARKTAEAGKPSQPRAGQAAKGSGSRDTSAADLKQYRDVVNLVSLENRRASLNEERPTLEEAHQALRNLQDDLKTSGQDLGEIHSNLDRRLILSLLAPLVTS